MIRKAIVTRRRFLGLTALLAGTSAVAACSSTVTPAPPTSSNQGQSVATAKPEATTPQGAPPAATSAAASSPTVVMKFLNISNKQEEPCWNDVVAAFQKSHSTIKVELEQAFVGWPQIVQKEAAYAAAGDPRDVLRQQHADLPTLLHQDRLTDLMSYAQQDKWSFSDHWDAIWAYLKRDGHLWGFAPGVYTMARLYNKELFDKAAIKPIEKWADAWTWDQLLENGQKLTSGDGASKTYGLLPILSNMLHGQIWLWQNGAEFLDETGSKCLLDEPNAIETIQFEQDLINKYKVAPAPVALKSVPETQMFQTGRLAIDDQGQWALPPLRDSKMQYGIMPLSIHAGHKPVTLMAIDYWNIPKPSKHKDEAWQMLKFLNSEEAENILIKYHVAGVPTLKSLTEKQQANLFGVNPDVWLESMNVARPFRTAVNFQEIRDKAASILGLVESGEKDAKSACSEVTQEVNKMLAANPS